MTFNEAKKALQELELDIKIESEPENIDKSKAIITNQIPKEGIKMKKGEYVLCKIE